MGKVHHYASIGQPLEPGWAKDAGGRDTTDAAAARLGSIAPFGEAKGYALGLALELLVAGTANSALAPEIGGTLDAEKPCNKGDVFIVIDTAASTSLKDRLGAYLDVVRACPAEDGSRPVAVPGDGARRRKAQAREFGFEVDQRLLETLTSMLPQSSSSPRALSR
jgi:LDH2 family malate/lactate/ureidoglycolate dehydrogenase